MHLIKDRPQTTRPAEPPEVRDAVAKAKEFAALAEAETNPKQKAIYDRMSRTWPPGALSVGVRLGPRRATSL